MLAVKSTTKDQPSKKRKRPMTSAIPNLSVGTVRKCVAEIRKKWEHRSLQEPFYGSDLIQIQTRTPEDSGKNNIDQSGLFAMTIENFALHFVFGQIKKRHNKSNGNDNERA